MQQDTLVMRGKRIASSDLDVISRLVGEHYDKGRTFISARICEQLGWFQPNGQFQGVACREILRRLESLNLISLPSPMRPANNEVRRLGPDTKEPCLFEMAGPEKVESSLKDGAPAKLSLVADKSESRSWRFLIARYHYLGYAPIVGRSLKYFIHWGSQIVGAISWTSACWKLASRDSFIGWDPATRQRNLQSIASNNRFLILPWIKVKNLASHVLGLASREVPKDWERIYGIKLNLLESFVDPSRFKGTCYKAANWIYLGQSKGASKSGNSYRWHGQVKDVYVLALSKDFRRNLCQS